MQQDYRALEYASDELKIDKDIVVAVVNQNSSAYENFRISYAWVDQTPDESSDEETTGNKTRPSKHNLMTTTIGNDPNVLGADHSSDSSSEEDDGESDDTSEDEDGERFPSFQKFDTRSGNLGIRTS